MQIRIDCSSDYISNGEYVKINVFVQTNNNRFGNSVIIENTFCEDRSMFLRIMDKLSIDLQTLIIREKEVNKMAKKSASKTKPAGKKKMC